VTHSSSEDDDAASKLWSVYIGEAQRYDEDLLRGWKEDMDGLLLFVRITFSFLFEFSSNSFP